MPKFRLLLNSFVLSALVAIGGCAGVKTTPDLVDFERFGSGPEKVIVLHDWLGDRRNFDPIRPYLDGEQFTYAFLDLRGYGGSKTKAGKFSAAEAANDAIAVADSLGWKRFHIVGHSMSGMIVQRVGANAPERIKSMVATTPVSAAGMHVDDKTYGFFKAVVTDPKAATAAIGLLTGKRLSKQWAAFKVNDAMTRSTPEARLAYLDMFDKTDFSADVAGLKFPVLVLLGKNDLPAFQPASIKSTFGAWYPNLSIVVTPNAGHYPMQETPVFYATSIEAHMSKHKG